MLNLVTLLVAVILAALVVVNLPATPLLAGLAAWWALGVLPTRWAWEVFVGQDKSRGWKWAWAAALGGLWPVWVMLAVLCLVGEARAKKR
ncbi:MAG: hypothetical protein KQI62_02160 [Deltaproteobacteria bacterium]|nr:hypothetical protein [Deltaproteobacteria bacterium]